MVFSITSAGGKLKSDAAIATGETCEVVPMIFRHELAICLGVVAWRGLHRPKLHGQGALGFPWGDAREGLLRDTC